MATLFTVLIGLIYLFSHQSPIWASKSFGRRFETESTTAQSVLLPSDVKNSSSSVLSDTYKSSGSRFFPSLSLKSRIRAKFPTHRPETLAVTEANWATNDVLPISSTLPPIIRSRMIFSPVSLSPFLPNLLHPHLVSGTSSTASSQSLQLPINYYRNRSIFLPNYNSRILSSNQQDFNTQLHQPQQPLPVLITTTSTVRPKPVLTKGPILSNNATSLPNDDYSIEAVIPVNLSAHFKLINSQQQQRVVLNNIQEIINSLKNEELREANETTNNITGRGSGWNTNQPTNSKNGNFSAFKLRFLEKLREHQNLMKGKNSMPPLNSTKALPAQTTTEKRKQNSLKQFVNGSSTSMFKSSAAEPGNLFKIESYTLPKRNINHQHHSTPSTIGNQTQWQAVELLMNEPVKKPAVVLRSKLHKQIAETPLKQLNSNAYNDSQKKLIMKPKNGRGEEPEESAFMAHLKNYLSKLTHKPDSDQEKLPLPHSSSLGSSSQQLQMIIRSPMAVSSVVPAVGTSEADRIDYGEVERILAFVNPYGRRISMPHINTEYSSSLTAESRNVRLQRSAVSSGNASEDTLPLSSLWDHMSNLNQSSQLLVNKTGNADWLDNLFEKFNNETRHRTASKNTSDDLFDFIRFPSSKSNFSREVIASNEKNNGPHYTSKMDADFTPNKIVKYGMRNSYVGSAQESNFGLKRPLSVEENMSERSKGGLSGSSVYPKERFDSAEKWRQLENGSDFLSDTNHDWVSYFEHLQRTMPGGLLEQSDRKQFLAVQPTENNGDQLLLNVSPFDNDQQAAESFDGITTETTVMSSMPLPITIPSSSSAQLSVVKKHRSYTAKPFPTINTEKLSTFEQEAKEKIFNTFNKNPGHSKFYQTKKVGSNQAHTPSNIRSYGHRINHALLLPPTLPSMSDVAHYGPPVHPLHFSQAVQYDTNQLYKTFLPMPPDYPHYHAHQHPPYVYY